MYGKILLAVDNSDCSTQAARLAVEVARRFSSMLVGCHVYAGKLHDKRFTDLEPVLPDRFKEPKKLESSRSTHEALIGRGLRMISESYLDPIDALCRKHSVAFERSVIEGKHYAEIVKTCEAGVYGMLVLGARGLAAMNGASGLDSGLGSVSERVLRRVSIDVLVVRRAEMSGGPISVGIDGSPESYDALRRAINLSREFGAPVEAVSAFDPDFHSVAFKELAHVLSEEASRMFRFKEQEELHGEIINGGLERLYHGYLENAALVARGKGVDISCTLSRGKAAPALLGHARDSGSHLIVVSRFGMHRVEGLDIGSTAEAVARRAGCNVFVVGAVAEASSLQWTPEALERLDRAPGFVRPMARKAVESYARARGIRTITPDIVEEARKGHGVNLPGHRPDL